MSTENANRRRSTATQERKFPQNLEYIILKIFLW